MQIISVDFTCASRLLHAGDPQRIALEGYSGLVAHAVTRASYKSDIRAKQTSARQLIAESLEQGRHPLGVTLQIHASWRERLFDDGTADLLDARLCAIAAA